MLDAAQFRRSENYSEFVVGQEEDIVLRAIGTLEGVRFGRDLSSPTIEVHLRFYDASRQDGVWTLIEDYEMTKLAGTAVNGDTGKVRKAVVFDAECSSAVCHFVAVDTSIVRSGTPSGKREIRLCKPWQLVVRVIPVAA